MSSHINPLLRGIRLDKITEPGIWICTATRERAFYFPMADTDPAIMEFSAFGGLRRPPGFPAAAPDIRISWS
jgi:hypothetical protein